MRFIIIESHPRMGATIVSLNSIHGLNARGAALFLMFQSTFMLVSSTIEECEYDWCLYQILLS